jgi:mitogen-activated protein kinase kinase kinase 4
VEFIYSQLSREQDLWQNELKDVVWLQLQAWRADRTLTEQDRYLFKARQNVAELLNGIMEYR